MFESVSHLLEQSSRKRLTLGNLIGSSSALALSEYCQHRQNLSVIVTHSAKKAHELQQEMQCFSPNLVCEYLPGLETLPYDLFSPHQNILSQRIRLLARLDLEQVETLILSIETLMHYFPPKEFISSQCFLLKTNDTINAEYFIQKCLANGYHKVNQVLDYGEFAVRGSIIDVFPMGSKTPFRLDLFDDEIESIRTFDCESQKSIANVDEINLLPALEYPMNDEAISRFRQKWRDTFSGNPTHCPLYEQVSEQITPAGIEYYHPLFFEKVVPLFDYFSNDSELIFIGDIDTRGEDFYKEANFRYEQKSHDVTRPILPPSDLFISVDKVKELANSFKRLDLKKEQSSHYNATLEPLDELRINRKAQVPLEALRAFINNHPDEKILLCAESAGRLEVLLDLLKEACLHPVVLTDYQSFLQSDEKLTVIISPLQEGFINLENKSILIPESAILGHTNTITESKKSFDPNTIIKDLTELKMNAPIVHLEHGVGRYLGLTHIETNGLRNEFLILEYANEDKIYVPVTNLDLISRYTGGDLEHAPLNRLGSSEWGKARKKAQEKISDVACELLEIYAKRDARVGFQIEKPGELYQDFVNEFRFEDTPDQAKASLDIINDFCSTKPMDRLICGDVGFGKTEIAMRAAFLKILNKQQVCLLVPTTLLASQHFENFRDRFANTACKIELISRFRTKKETEDVISGLENGSVDLVIGTHKLLQKGIQFKNLGLLIIDEEHRFGVKQKEHIKAMRAEVDILSMTATPIPRTLNMAMNHLRDISIIATPPAKRLAIKTFCYQKNKQLVCEAVLREIMRGGQVFYLHNSVETILHAKEELQEWLPNAKIEIAHGQMRERQLEKIMSDFYHHRFNVLLCTTIIETGIDIPTANTIIIDRADKFGLAQLHQLRGRVGRSHNQAYAYLLTPDQKLLTRDALKRLEAITTHEELGAGFLLATHDLEIRGAGEILGEEQSGSMQAIGFNLYMELLERAVGQLKAGKTPELDTPLNHGAEIKLPISTILPDDYIHDVHTRLVLYKRIASCHDKKSLDELQIEMIDRFGLLPPSAKNLFKVTKLKQILESLSVTHLSAKGEKGTLSFSESASLDPGLIINLIQVHAKRFKLKSSNSLHFFIDPAQDLLDELFKMLQFFDKSTAS
jgi:transcription-repair coupling factor (superfamily II helicase)